MVLQHNGSVGFAPMDDLVIIQEPMNKIDTVESLGGFRLGDRIEKLIGTLDRDYKVIRENGTIYSFPDDYYVAVDPLVDIFSSNRSLDVFVDEYFRTTLLRTDSPQFKLQSGFKVGDKAKEVLSYYEEHYPSYDDAYYTKYSYQLSKMKLLVLELIRKNW